MLGGSLSRYVPPGAQYDYRPPSVFERYKILSGVFALLLLAMVLFFVLMPHHPRSLPPAPLAAPQRPAAGAPAADGPAAPAGPKRDPGAAAAEPVYVVPLAQPTAR